MRSTDLPEGITMTRRKIEGKRVVIKNKRTYGNQRLYVAEWPDANLQELAVPKLACIVSGVADYLVGDACVSCGPGTFILMPPLIPHQCHAPNLQGEHLRNGSCGLLHALAHKHGVLFWYSRSINERFINEFSDNYLISSVAAVQTLHLLMDEATEAKAHSEFVIQSFIAAFFGIIAREIGAGNYMHPGPKENISGPAHLTDNGKFSEMVREYLEMNCHRPLRLETMAAHMYLSRAQFSRRMKQETGMTFVEMLTQVRMEQACKMLKETDFTSIAIATCLSFHSSTHFQSLFRSRMGCTPMEYRRKNAPKN